MSLPKTNLKPLKPSKHLRGVHIFVNMLNIYVFYTSCVFGVQVYVYAKCFRGVQVLCQHPCKVGLVIKITLDHLITDVMVVNQIYT